TSSDPPPTGSEDHPAPPSDPLEGLHSGPPFLVLDAELELRQLPRLVGRREEGFGEVYVGERRPGGSRPGLAPLHDRAVLVVLGRRQEPHEGIVGAPDPRTPRIDV